MTNPWPALTVRSGPQAGQSFTMRTDQASVGRSPDADLRLESPDVSRHHLRLSRQGNEVFVQDLGSANGTYLNGSPLAGTRALRPGDTLRVADVELQVMEDEASTIGGSAPSSRSYDFGAVRGPVNTGDPINYGGSQIVGSGSIYHGEVVYGDRVDVDVGENDLQELFSGRGPGRVLLVIGIVVTIVGFGIFMSVIFSITGMISSGIGQGPGFEVPSSPFGKEIFGLNAAATGFAMFGLGGLLMILGANMSKAARKREERRYR